MDELRRVIDEESEAGLLGWGPSMEGRQSRRTNRIEDLLRAELSDLILRELRDPRVSLVSITRVEVTGDLRHAKVSVSALGSEEQRAAAVTALDGARGLLRSRLALRLKLRVVPDLTFVLDRGAEYSQKISDLLEELDHGADDHS
jgi:ribosome-binding factor A